MIKSFKVGFKLSKENYFVHNFRQTYINAIKILKIAKIGVKAVIR